MKIEDAITSEFFGSAPQAMMLLNSGGRIEAINDMAKKALMPFYDEIKVGTKVFDLPWFERNPNGEVSPEKVSIAQLLREKETIIDINRGLNRTDQNSFVWFKISACPVNTDDSSAPGFMLCLHDISEEIATQEALSHHAMGQNLFLKISRDLHYLSEDKDLDPTLRNVLFEAGKMFQAERCFLFHEKAEEVNLSSFYSCELGEVPPIHCDCSRELFLELKSAYGESTDLPMSYWLVDSDEAPEGILDEYMQQEGIKSLLLLPILNMNRKCVGLLGFERFDHNLHFDSADSKGVEFLADIMGAFFDRYLKASNLRERVKEMHCLDRVNQLIINENDDKEAYLQAIVDAIPPGFLYPGQTKAILKAGEIKVSCGKAAKSSISHSLKLDLKGLNDSYLKVQLAEGLQFLKEEYDLIERIAKVLEQESERKKQEVQLREQKQRLQAILEAIPESIFVLDKEGGYLEFYQGKNEDTEDQSHFIGLHIQDAHRPEVANEMMSKIEACLKYRNPQSMIYSRKSGKNRRWYEVSLTPIDDNRVLKLLQDITFRRQHEEQLQRFNIAIQQSPVGIIITDLDGYIEYASPSMEQISGYSPKQLEGMSTQIFYSGKSDAENYHLWEAIKSGKTWEGELLNRNCNNDLYWEHITVTPIKKPSGEVYKYMALKQNVDQERKAQEQLIKQKEIFREIAHAQSHEVRAPLARILGLIELIKQGPLEDTILNGDLLQKLTQSGKELDDIIRVTVEKVIEAERMYH